MSQFTIDKSGRIVNFFNTSDNGLTVNDFKVLMNEYNRTYYIGLADTKKEYSLVKGSTLIRPIQDLDIEAVHSPNVISVKLIDPKLYPEYVLDSFVVFLVTVKDDEKTTHQIVSDNNGSGYRATNSTTYNSTNSTTDYSTNSTTDSSESTSNFLSNLFTFRI